MSRTRYRQEPASEPKILLVDDENDFRIALARQLSVRGFQILEVDNGNDAIKIVHHENPDIVILDQKMPGMDGIQTLKEITRLRPEVQVIMLTGHGSTEAARVAGKHNVAYYVTKPCAVDELVQVIEAARRERIHALARHEIPNITRSSAKQWLIGAHHARPGVILLGLLLFACIVLMPTPDSLRGLLSLEKSGQQAERIAGYSEYRKMESGQTVAESYCATAGLGQEATHAGGGVVDAPREVEQTAVRAKVMVGVLVMAALFWATGAIPVGITALVVGVVMCFFGVLPPNLVAKAYAKDSVIFIFGVLALAAAISRTGLDRRIGMLLLGRSSSLPRFAFLFAPLLAVTAAFLSEHALVAFLAPILMLVYSSVLRTSGLKQDRALIVMMLLLLTFSANVGGPGSPAAGGRNAVMLGILADYDVAPTFGQWVSMGLPFVPVMAIVIAGYLYFVFRKRISIPRVNIAAEVRQESAKLGRMTRQEYCAAGVLVLLIVLWVTLSGRFGMGGPALLCLVLLNLMGILRWRDINRINWDVVALYGAATALGYGLATTGAALWLADSLIAVLPESMRSGTGLCVSCSVITAILTNFMSDGATVAAVGPITVPMGMLSGTSPVTVGLATAFASSFAHMFIIGTPNNAIAYAMARDPETGEQLLTTKDFFVHGFVVLLLSLTVLWVWVFLGYWKWMGL